MRRAYFKNNWMAALFVAPQLLIIFVFFYWPATQALYWAFTLEQPWGGGNEWVGLENFQMILSDDRYWHSVRVSIIYAAATTILAMGMALILALFADRQLTGYKFYRIGLIWPYAIAAPAVGLSFRFIFNPAAGVMSYVNEVWPGVLGSEPERHPCDDHGDHCGVVETGCVLLHLLPGRAPGHPPFAH